MTTVGQELQIRGLEAADEPGVLGLLTSAMGEGPSGNRTSDFFRWKHRLSPFGVSPGLVAIHNGQTVAVRLFMRWELEAEGQHLRAFRAVDTATHSDFQGRGIFRTLTLELLRILEQEGEVDLVFNTPNASSRPGYLKMGWHDVGTLSVHVGVAKPVRFLRGVRSASAATARSSRRGIPPALQDDPAPCPLPTTREVLPELSSRLAELLTHLVPARGLHTPRTMEYLTWRYAEAPGLDYRCITVESQGRLEGLAIGRMRRRGCLNELTLSELLVHGGSDRVTRELLSAARRSGADHVSAHLCQRNDRRAAARAGFVPIPRAGLDLVANPRRLLPVDALDVRSWELSLGDLEVF